MTPASRRSLPKAADRRPLGRTGLAVGPICVGATSDENTIPAAFDAGVNFFFVTCDLHWPVYEATRRGLAKLLERGPGIRDRIVVAAVSYLEEPMFSTTQFQEVIQAVPGLNRIDVITGGAFNDQQPLYPRIRSLQGARGAGIYGSRAVGGSFHSRRYALESVNSRLVDVAFIRYNARHAGARKDTLPWLRADRETAVFSFKSTVFRTTPGRMDELGLTADKYWRPSHQDHYRFALSTAGIDGILCSPLNPAEAEGIVEALGRGALTNEEERYMMWLASLG